MRSGQQSPGTDRLKGRGQRNPRCRNAAADRYPPPGSSGATWEARPDPAGAHMPGGRWGATSRFDFPRPVERGGRGRGKESLANGLGRARHVTAGRRGPGVLTELRAGAAASELSPGGGAGVRAWGAARPGLACGREAGPERAATASCDWPRLRARGRRAGEARGARTEPGGRSASRGEGPGRWWWQRRRRRWRRGPVLDPAG